MTFQTCPTCEKSYSTAYVPHHICRRADPVYDLRSCSCSQLTAEVARLTEERDLARAEVLRFVAGGVTLPGWWCMLCEPDTWNPESNVACKKCGMPKRGGELTCAG